MSQPRSLSELTRQKLYEVIWSTPATKLSMGFGILDVAIAKRCKKLNVPRPPHGYWAKVEVGHKLRKPPLPPTPEEIFQKVAQQPVGKALQLPGLTESLHPLAAELMQALNTVKLDSKKRPSIRERTLPELSISKSLAKLAVWVFHTILKEVEPHGIAFRKAQSPYDSGYFQKGHNRIYLTIEEELVENPQEFGASSRRRSSWQSHTDSLVPSGKLTFSLKTERYEASKAKQWAEGENVPLGELLAQIVTEIRRHYVEVQTRRAQEAIEQEKQRLESERRQLTQQEEEIIRRQEERERKYAESIASTMRIRKDDLLKAAQGWRLHQFTQEFIVACEQRWRQEQAGDLKPDQEEWLQWTRKTAKVLPPVESGYPEPEKDGAFSALTVPSGGPYPETQEFSRPPTMPEIPAPMVVQQSYGVPSHQPAPQPYPF